MAMARRNKTRRTVNLLAGLALLAAPAAVRAQDPEILPELPGANLPEGTAPSVSQREVMDLLAPTGESAATAAAASPLAPPPFGVTGDWFGARTSLQDSGISLRTNFTQFYQGVTGGGLEERFRYGAKFDYFAVIEGEKLLGLKGLLINLHGESRFGQSVNGDDGALLPSNFAMQFPRGQGQASALTNMQIQQFLSENFVVTFGKINTADGVNIHPFMGGYGTDRFMNTAFVLDPTYGRAIPYSTPGAGFSYLKNFDPVFTFLAVDPMGRPDTAGIEHLFSNGVSLFSQLRVPVKPAGLPGHQILSGAWSSGKFAPLSGDSYILLPGPLPFIQKQTGTWVLSYGFDQFLVVDPANPRKGWGIFGNLSLTDGNPNPARWFLNLGVGGTSPLPGRSADSFGLAYYYMGVSDPLKDSLANLFPLRNEQGFELFYNAALTDWFMLTADIQAMDPGRVGADSAFLFGLRGKIIF